MLVIFDSNEYSDLGDYDFILDSLKTALDNHIKKPRGNIKAWAFLAYRSSQYGSIAYNGQRGYMDIKTQDLAQAILETSTDHLFITADGEDLQVIYTDYDGSHICTVRPVISSKLDHYNYILSREFNTVIEYIQALPTVKVKREFITGEAQGLKAH